MKLTAFSAVLWGSLLPAWIAYSHPIPDIPVRTDFRGDTASIQVEVDPRSFTDDPEDEPYLFNRVLKQFTEEEKKDLQEKAQLLIDKTVYFEFRPDQRFIPKFTFEFAGIGADELSGDEDPVMLIGTAEVKIPSSGTGYRIIADISGDLSVIFRNSIEGKEIERFNVLFPGESSFFLDLPGKK